VSYFLFFLAPTLASQFGPVTFQSLVVVAAFQQSYTDLSPPLDNIITDYHLNNLDEESLVSSVQVMTMLVSAHTSTFS
jgi:hypothetical protein